MEPKSSPLKCYDPSALMLQTPMHDLRMRCLRDVELLCGSRTLCRVLGLGFPVAWLCFRAPDFAKQGFRVAV